ncbi:MAG: nucleotidyl transferase AbiEii/AbiGii toxin family protein, partial [Simkaniaceae bacterium]|nr:nucleotidyl transferase AbiEii/AbiGii toxin family protein [Simkaniaceae bacterium]
MDSHLSEFLTKQRGLNFNECWKKLLLERFLSRLSRSAYTQQFIFKGGFLLAYIMEIGRETTDLDFLLTSIAASKDEIKEAIEEII